MGNGSIDVQMTQLKARDDMSFSTGSGSVRVKLPAGYNGELHAINRQRPDRLGLRVEDPGADGSQARACDDRHWRPAVEIVFWERPAGDPEELVAVAVQRWV